MRSPSPFSASTRAGMTVLLAHSTTVGSENVVLSMILHGPHHAATTSSMTGLPSAFARIRTSAKGLPSRNGTWTAAGAPAFAGAGGCLEGEEDWASVRAAGGATSATATAAMKFRNRKWFLPLFPLGNSFSPLDYSLKTRGGKGRSGAGADRPRT